MSQWSLLYPNDQQDPTDPRAPRVPDAASISLTGDFTVEFWLRKVGSHSGNTDRVIVGKDHSTNFQWLVRFNETNGDSIKLAVYETSGGTFHEREWTGLTTDNADEWHHVAITFDGSAGAAGTQMELFLDSVSQGNGSAITENLLAGTFDSDGDLVLGGLNDATGVEELKGYALADVRLWSDLRTGTEIANNYLVEQDPTAANLVGNWLTGRPGQRLFPSASGATVLDRTSNNNDAPLPTGLTDSEDTVRELELFPQGYTFFGTDHVDNPDSGEAYTDAPAVNPSAQAFIESDPVEAFAESAVVNPTAQAFVESDPVEVFLDGLSVYSAKADAPVDSIEVLSLGLTGIALDTNPPVVQNVSPAFPGVIAQDTPITFDVVDVDPGVQMVIVTLRYGIPYSGQTLVVHDGSKFVAPFDSPSSGKNPIANGFAFSVVPVGGWPATVEEIFVYKLDDNGNLGALP